MGTVPVRLVEFSVIDVVAVPTTKVIAKVGSWRGQVAHDDEES